MTSCFHIIQESARVIDDAYVLSVRQVAAPGAKFAVSDCMLSFSEIYNITGALDVAIIVV